MVYDCFPGFSVILIFRFEFVQNHRQKQKLNKKSFLSPQVFTLIGFILVQCSQHSAIGSAQFFSTIAMIAFWFSLLLLVLYLFHAIYVFHKIPWTKIEFYFCVGATLFLMLSSSLIIAKGVTLFTAAGVSIFTFDRTEVHWKPWHSDKNVRQMFQFTIKTECQGPIVLEKIYWQKSIIFISIPVCLLSFSVLWICCDVRVRIWRIFEISAVQYRCDECRNANHYSVCSINCW